MTLPQRFATLTQAELPLPGTGRTGERWQALAATATEDLALAKLAESHFDALAILAELGAADLHPSQGSAGRCGRPNRRMPGCRSPPPPTAARLGVPVRIWSPMP